MEKIKAMSTLRASNKYGMKLKPKAVYKDKGLVSDLLNPRDDNEYAQEVF